jgi:ABC-type bacteriocin/lantibiotic exporter with double-glycine peptidase domain
VIAHRLSTIRNADTIVVMDAGRAGTASSTAPYNSSSPTRLAEAS